MLLGIIFRKRNPRRMDQRVYVYPHVPIRQQAGQRLLCLVAAVCVWLASPIALLRAQVSDSFEGGPPRWQLVESDCQAQVDLNEISPSLPRSGQACELIEIYCGTGTYAYLAMPIEPSAIIDEFAPSVWVQCMSGRIRIGANVVFPNATHPETGGRLHAILWGSTYDQPGHWQRLELAGSARLLSAEITALRQRFGPKINVDGAYIDSLVLNAYTGPGRYRIKLDDLSLRGMIPVSSLGQAVPDDWRARWRWRGGDTREQDRWTLTQAGRIPVWWQYQGESLPWLYSLGFRGLSLNRFPSEALLSEARSAKLAVISPPPAQKLAVDADAFDAVKGWLVGAAVDSRGLDALRQEVTRISQLGEPLRRPTIAEGLEEYWALSRVVDELVVPAPSNMSAGPASDQLRWLRASVEDSSRRGSGWVSITTDALPSWYEQIRQAQKVVEPTMPELETTDPVQLRLQVARAVAAGARGFLFRSSTPLDITSNEHRVRVAAMRTVNRDLTLVGPWVTGGQIAPIPKIDREDYTAAAWIASQSHLIVFLNNSAESQYSVPPTRDRPLKASMPLPAGVNHVMRITGGAAQSLLLTPSPEGMTWEIPEPGPIEFCVLTDNPLVQRYVLQHLNETAVEAATDALDIADHQLELATKLTSARWPQTVEGLPGRYLSTITAARERVDQGYQELRANRTSRAIEAASQAYEAAQLIVHESFRTATSNLATPQSSPLVLSPASLPYHWMLARACERSTWRQVPLPGNDLASLDTMLQAGWSQQRRLDQRAEMLVELVPQLAEEQKGPGLRLAALAKPGQTLPGGYEGASIRVRSAPSQTSPGELVRVTARAIIRRAPVDPGAGLLVYDNKAGPALGQLVRGQTGEVVSIELYRFVTDDTPFRVLTELRGACDIVLEGIALSAIQPAVNQSTYPTKAVADQQ